MKRAILIVMTIAVLGALGMYVQKKPSAQTGNSSNITTLGANTSSSSGSNNSFNSASSSTSYKDGTYQGSSADTAYGTVQIAIVVSGGRIADVNFNQMPSDQGHSREVTAYAAPLLKQSTIQAQGANIEFVSGATSTSEGYEQSLQAAINRAVNA